ncbi:NAD-dependent succinate-semialdehyde dehydrogenase [Desertibacillus haloalkaliphilus]|nr:NAD-dependent succinate-semialdehyde dehydrogenase [Desertibacillus haloalkaliphilus]
MYCNGEWIGADLDRIKVTNPATGEVIGSVPNGGKSETKQAIAAANEAFKGWSKKTANERASYLKKLYELVVNHSDELAELITKEMGKPKQEAAGEVGYGASFIEWYAEEGKRVYGETIPASHDNKRLHVWKQPVGVVAAITPWNFPAAMITRKVAPALAAGCTVVLKPAEDTPLTALRIAELVEEAGFPKGVFNIVTGAPDVIGTELMENPIVKKVTFTGSTEVGKLLMRQAADNVKKLSLELGGHAPFIILDDADVDKAVQGVVASKFRNAGQTCVCANRIYIQPKIYDAFIEKFNQEVDKLIVGDGSNDNVHIGPLINQSAYEKVDRHVQDALKQGAKLVTGGSGFEQEGAYFYKPTILKDVRDSMLIMNEETFGPVAPIQLIQSDEEAVQLANQTPYGLAAYVYSEGLSRGMKVVEALDYGIVGWNDGLPSVAQAPFGGMKESGLEREGGHHGIEPFLETKYVSIGL